MIHNVFEENSRKLKGKWTAEYDDKTEDSIILKQYGSMIWGEMIVVKGKEKNKRYKMKGSYRHPFVILEFRAIENKHVTDEDAGSVFLRVSESSGDLIGGMISLDHNEPQSWKGRRRKI